MSSFQASIDIANRAIQHCGVGSLQRIQVFGPPGVGDDSQACSETYFVYDKLREAELRSNVWTFAVRKCVLRPLATTSMTVNFPAWASGTTYGLNAVVSYVRNDGQTVLYFSKQSGNVGYTPAADSAYWTRYFGSLVATPWLANTDPNAPQPWSSTTNYALGAEAVGSDGNVYSSTINGNLNNNPVGDGGVHWYLVGVSSNGTGYYAGELVYDTSNVVYLSLINGNTDDPPTSNWVTLTSATLSTIDFIWPIGSGPSTQTQTRNVYMLPNGYLRRAPEDPKMGLSSYLGAPANRQIDDWEFEANCFVSRDIEPITFRFVADIDDVTLMDPMFCEGLAAKIGMEVCEPLTQSDGKLKNIASEYSKFISDARAQNGIEQSTQAEPLDDWLACRI